MALYWPDHHLHWEGDYKHWVPTVSSLVVVGIYEYDNMFGSVFHVLNLYNHVNNASLII